MAGTCQRTGNRQWRCHRCTRAGDGRHGWLPRLGAVRATLGPGRLPGVVAYLLEQRTTSAVAPAGGGAHAAVPAARAAESPVESPAWLEATPSLVIVATIA